ncbi:DUF961 family protein [Melissococcus plutonius]|uniref:Uncharacterized protein n=2 Tax=Melissococcus plutonius TaxID=33970 RepID=A0A2Z5Y4T4_9ENTE|nr:DUF961 family protein [Melissococcus plutonius]KMT26978.1 hypothetical protein MEPL4_8c00130 [Melissococcus plutonius]KMT29111.1 hypothetical protein MEPL7_19p00190 [Melissococcus plutonius]KMT33561.1 hypothetical protein MEPL9_11c00140 [Melissococcus plutonius]KMT37177.1 hypothetical protein MEPL11_13c00020 [Melissococcus plutonius]MCV2499624.1 DUF961 family protein [Melissococcus plutonius]
MAKEKPINFDNNEIPILLKESVGKVTFVSVRNDKFVNDAEGNRTDEIRAQSIEVSSEAQRENFNVDLVPTFNLSALELHFGDEIELLGVTTCTPWAMLPPNNNNVNNAVTGFSIMDEGIKKVLPNQTTNNFSKQNEGDKKKEK